LPSRSEEVQIRGIIRNADQRIARIDATSHRIHLVLEQLAHERRIIQEFADKHRVMIAPVWELPPEILSYILLLSLPVRVDLHEINRSALKGGLTVARVNRHWRNVAVSTPQLWTTIHIDEKSFSKKGDDPEETCMPKLFLERSGVSPLSLSVHTTEYNEAILETLIPLAERWHRITLDTTLPMLSALSPIQNRLPLLKTLEIKNTHWTEGSDNNPLTFFSNAPLLRNLTSSSHSPRDFEVLPLHQLTRWDSPTTLAAIPKIFERAPNLEECFLQPLRPIPGTVIPGNEVVVCHKLTFLHISTGVVGSSGFQFQHLPQFPSLRRLFIYFDKRVFFYSAESILPLFVKSGKQLEHLMWGFGAPLTTISECLKHTPLLTTLQFHRITNDNLLRHLIAPNSDGVVLLPKLETLRLSGKTLFRVPSLLGLIRSRWKRSKGAEPLAATMPSGHERCLKSVLILPPGQDKFDTQRKKELLALNEEGFDVSICPLDRKAFLSHVTSPFPISEGESFIVDNVSTSDSYLGKLL